MNVNMLFEDFLALFIPLFVAFVLSQITAPMLWKIFEFIHHVFLRYFSTSIEIHADYRLSTNVTTWLNAFIKEKCKDKLGHFRITHDVYNAYKNFHLSLYGLGSVDTSLAEENADEYLAIDKQLEPLPTDWSVFFRYKSACIRVSRSIQRDIQSIIMEVYKVTAYGTTNKQILLDMFEEASELSEKKPASHINYFRAETHGFRATWRLVKRVQPRALSSIILREGITETIQKDIDEFIESREWYEDRGIPYRRGYLLHGPAGCGKTSFVKAISGQIGYDIYELQLSNLQLTDQNLNDLLSTIGERSILLFEDIDAVFTARPKDEETAEVKDIGPLSFRESTRTTGITFSGILNAIDGVASEEDYIVFMTSNHVNKLDSSLIRPGRIDLKQLIDYPDEKQIAVYFKKFYPDCDDELASKFAKAVNDLKCNPSMSQIQGVFLKHKKAPQDSLRDVASLVDVCKSDIDQYNFYI